MKVSITIPTYNRASFICDALDSAVTQTYKDTEIIVVDNCSTDNTKEVVEEYKVHGVKYIRNKKNIGMMQNWNKCVKVSSGKLLVVLGDDDILHPDFLVKSLKVFKTHPDLGFTFSHINKVDQRGKKLKIWGYDYTRPGKLSGVDYLMYTALYSCCLTNSSSVLLNKDVFKKVGTFGSTLSQNTFDFNMWIKIANDFPVYFIDDILADYRIHEDQVSQVHWRNKQIMTGKIGTYVELMQLASLLLSKHEIKTNQKKLRFLAGRISYWNEQLTRLVRQAITNL